MTSKENGLVGDWQSYSQMVLSAKPVIVRMYHVKRRSSWKKRPGAIPEHKLVYCYEGATIYELPGSTCGMSSGSIAIIPANVPHSGYTTRHTIPSFFSVRFSLEDFPEDAKAHEPLHPCIATMRRRTYVFELFQRLFELSTGAPSEKTRLYSAEILRTIFLESTVEGSIPGDHLSESYQRIRKAKTYMECRPSDSFDLETLSREAGYSPRYFSRMFKEFEGMSPRHAHTLIRLNFGRMLIEEEGASVKEAAYRSGYSEQQIFSRLFTRHFGSSPSKARARAYTR